MAVRVGVCLITYNHERYLAQALDGVVAQEGDFELDVAVGVDVSSDATLEIARDYERRYPGTVRVLAHPARVGMMGNLMATFAACAGAEYVAVLEGDDRWTSKQKLQRQVGYLRENPGCTVCYHDVRVRYETSPPRVESARRPGRRSTWTFEEFVLAPHWAHTCSVVYRNGLQGRLPAWMAGLRVGDWPLHVLHAALGWVGRIPEELAEYRVHAEGVWSGATSASRELAFLDVYDRLDRHFAGRHHAALTALRYSRLLNAACVTEDESERRWALREAAACAADAARRDWPWRVKMKRYLGYRGLRTWRLLAYGRPGGRA